MVFTLSLQEANIAIIFLFSFSKCEFIIEKFDYMLKSRQELSQVGIHILPNPTELNQIIPRM